MSKQENGLSRRERSGITAGFNPRKRIVAGIVVLLVGLSTVFSGGAAAHSIDLDKAQEVARNYARSVRTESRGNYLHYSTKCVRAFPGHNHFVRCSIEYQNAKDTAAGVYTCKEMIEVYFYAHGRPNAQNYVYILRHTSGNICGSRKLNGEVWN